MSGLDRVQFANELQAAAFASFMRTYDAEPAVYSQICEVRDITEGSQLWYGDKEIIYSGMSDYRRREDGGRYENDRPVREGVSQVAMQPFSRSHEISSRQLMSITAGDAARQITNIADQVIADWGSQAVREYDGWLADSLEAGVIAAGSKPYYDNTYLDNIDANPGFIYDGKAFFAADHPLEDGSSLSNINVTAPLTQANLDAAVTKMYGTNAIDYRGRRARIRPSALMVNPLLVPTATKLVQSVTDPEASTGAVNTNAGLPLIVNPYLTSTTGWFLLARLPRPGMVFYRTPTPRLNVNYLPETDEIKIAVDIVFGFRVRDWRSGIANNYPTS
jgi:hypothetical protein